jgi:hypothetical protein
MSSKKRSRDDNELDPRVDPAVRGIHPDAIRSERSVSGRATCVDCSQLIPKRVWRWGIQYAGNPVSEPVLPLYGSHPMYSWLHAAAAGGCGLSYYVLGEDDCPALRTCHACEDTPGSVGDLRLFCGGKPKGKKIRGHPFHIKCWKKAMTNNKELIVDPALIIGWDELSESDQALVRTQLLIGAA